VSLYNPCLKRKLGLEHSFHNLRKR